MHVRSPLWSINQCLGEGHATSCGKSSGLQPEPRQLCQEFLSRREPKAKGCEVVRKK